MNVPYTSIAGATVPAVRESWQRIEGWIAADPARLPGGLNGPAPEHAIAALHASLGTTLPDDLLESLRLHDGQADPDAVFAEGDAMLSAHEIGAQWSIWNKLVSGGDFDDMTSDPAAGIRDDWYNLADSVHARRQRQSSVRRPRSRGRRHGRAGDPGLA